MTRRTTRLPILGIVPSFDDGASAAWHDGVQRLFLRRDYFATLSNVGATPVILSPDMDVQQVIELCDGVIISGGADIDPSRYGQERIAQVVKLEPAERFDWETELIEACDAAGTPILGICYGMQRLNVHYGGDLMQHIPLEVGDTVEHFGAEHEVHFVANFLGISEGSSRQVASRHHQAVARLAEGAEIVAKADDGIVEAMTIRGHYGMQWHPESDLTGVHVYRAFVESCQRAVY